MADWTFAKGHEIAAAVSRGEVTRAGRRGICAVDDSTRDQTLNAFTDVTAERALARARSLDAARAAGKPLGPLAGVPFAVKNLFDVKGLPTRAGSKINRELPPAQHDSPLIEKMEAPAPCWSARSTWANTPMTLPARTSMTDPRAIRMT